MTTVLENWGEKGNFVELYEVVRTVVVNKNDKVYRIEVLKGYANPAIPYSTRCDVRENENGRSVWVGYELPWTNRDDAEGALQQALSFLANAEALGVGR
jgi:hypothetical protein